MFQRKRNKKGFKNKKKLYIFIYIILTLLLAIYGFILVDKKIKPTVLAIAEIKAKEIATKAINESVNKKITDDIRYQDLYFVRTDSEGNITLMQANAYITKLLKIKHGFTHHILTILYLNFLHPTQFFSLHF
ncbi:MAG: hypothetical protein PWQ37_2933 [Candidatus Petromonas sp.]|nr:hypothetical protein [Candidatus Petromonas sp.]